MSLRDEIEVYDKVKIFADTGEIEVWDQIIFPKVIRERQIRLILDAIEQTKHEKILDFGCGTGWLSKILSSKGYNVTGIDVNASLVRSARESCGRDSFIVGDCMKLPFDAGVFDCIVGSAILHHLDTDQALAECHRVTSPGGILLLMEPNKLNPIAALGRKITNANVQTKDENPFYPRSLRNALVRTGWAVCDFQYLFPYSFGLSYLLKIIGLGDKQWLNAICSPIEISEQIFEKVPYLNQLCYLIFVVVKKV
jgi:ubiquinone/menaquinone biosynthesis C-methylase UbiE